MSNRRFLRLYFLTCVFLLVGVSTVMGCAVTRKSISNYQACVNDSACYAEMMNVRNFTTVSVARAVDQVPGASPVANACVS